MHRSFAICLLLPLLSSCTKPPDAPNLMTAQQHQSGVIEGAGSSGYAGITERIAALPQDVYEGTDVQFVDAISNQGAPSKGIKIVIKGPALEFMSAPKHASLESSEDSGGHSSTMAKTDLNFAEDGSGGLIAIAKTLPYQKDLRLLMTMTGVRNGDGELKIFVYPTDKKGKTTAIFSKHLRCLSASDSTGAGEPQVPTD
jgi:hypothetical protein